MNITGYIKTAAIVAVASTIATGAMAETDNTETVKFFYDAYNENNPDLLDKVLAENWEDIPPNPGQDIGRDAFKPYVAGAGYVFGDLKITNDDIIEAGNKVIVRSTIEAVHVGEFAGFEATNLPMTIMAIDIHEFNDEGLVVKTWHVEEFLSALYQIGAIGQ